MRQISLRVLILSAALGATACGGDEGLSRTFGLVRDAPDEFRVTTRAPLSMPPEFTLRPPRPGASRPQELTERMQAEQVLVPQLALEGAANTRPSAGQEALLAASGPSAPTDIRTQVDQDAQLDTGNRGFTEQLLFWRTPEPQGIAVDPEREAKRLRENAALGQGTAAGDTPIIQRRRRSLLGSIF